MSGWMEQHVVDVQNNEADLRSATLAERVIRSACITVACAPPGFGKSELLRVAEASAGRDPQYRILRLDGSSHRANPRAAADAVLQAKQDDIIIVDGLLGADGAALSEALTVRFQAVEPPRVWLALHHLRELALARFTVDGTAHIIDWRSLRLSDAEVRTRLDRIPPRFRKIVGEFAKNWPAACTLLCRWAQQAHPEEADWEATAVLAASGLDEYIEQEIAPLLSVEEFNALVHASITETIEIDPDKRGIARPHALQAIAKASVKIAGLIERQGNRLTLHPALRQWLAARFEALPKEFQVESLARAAREFAARGDLVVAARLFRGAGMEEEIERIVIDGGSLLIWMTHGFPAVQEIVEQAGEAMVMRSPVLQLMRCIVLIKMARISDAQQLFASVDIKSCGKTFALERDQELVRVTLLVYGCGPRQDDDLERFHSIVAQTTNEPEWKSLLGTVSCILHTQRARFDVAMASLIDARARARSAESHYSLLFLSLHEANIHLAQGDLKKAKIALGDARKRWRQQFADDRGAETVMSALTASLEYELGQLTAARLSVRKSAHRMPDSEAWFDIYAAAYEPMARIIATDHGLGPAYEALADQRRRLVAQGLPRVAAMLQNFAIVLAGEQWLRGDEASARIWEALASIDEGSTWQEQEMFQLASSYLAMRDNQMDVAERLLRAGLANSDKLGLGRSSLRYRLVLGALLLRNGDKRSEGEIRQALLLGAQLGARQVFLHTMSPALAKVVKTMGELSDAKRPGLKRFVGTLRASSQAVETGQELTLSAREVDVLTALSGGGSDKVLGRALDMSEHGVRFHLKSIYRKLGVHDRLSAVHKAKEIAAI